MTRTWKITSPLTLLAQHRRESNCFVTFNNYKTKAVKVHHHRADPEYFSSHGWWKVLLSMLLLAYRDTSSHQTLSWTRLYDQLLRTLEKKDAPSHVPLEKVPHLRPRTISRRARPDQKLTIAATSEPDQLNLHFPVSTEFKSIWAGGEFFFNFSFPQMKHCWTLVTLPLFSWQMSGWTAFYDSTSLRRTPSRLILFI